jgi:hypothetical protein
LNEEGEDGEGEYPEEIAEENDDQGDWLLNVSSITYHHNFAFYIINLMEIDVNFASKIATLLCCLMIYIFTIWDTVYCSVNRIQVVGTIMTNINLLYVTPLTL